MKRWVVPICCFVLLVSLTGCGPSIEMEQKPVAYSVIDSTGTTLSFSEKPKRIVSLSLGTDEILMATVPHDRIVALSRLADDPGISNIGESCKDIPGRIDTRGEESVLAFFPDLVIAPEFTDPDIIRGLRSADIPVYVYKTPRSFLMIEDSIRHIAEVAGEPGAGDALVEEMERVLSDLERRVHDIPEKDRKRFVYFQENGVYSGRGSRFSEICRAAGVVNAVETLPFPVMTLIPEEELVSLNPDAFVFSDWSHGGKVEPRKFAEEVLGNPSYQTMKAVKQRQVCFLSAKYMQCLSQYAVQASVDLAKWSYPDRF